MGVNITPSAFEKALQFLTKHYTPVHLQDVLADDGGQLPPESVLLTFDDGYASVKEWAVPLCIKYGVPAVFFLNAAFLDNRKLAPDNLVCYAANTLGMDVINAAARAVKGDKAPRLQSLTEVFANFFPSISLSERRVFLKTLAEMGEIDEQSLAKNAGLYLGRDQVQDLARSGFAIGNHTSTHVHCRSLAPQDFGAEIDENRAELEVISGREVKAFSVPYGSSADLSTELAGHLRLSGHEAVFLSESTANPQGVSKGCVDRVSTHAESDGAFFFEIEVLPRLRSMRNRFLRGSKLSVNESECLSQ
jgi:peptidoglycan/xylan/chitin deacetylase (PgdA/CDA1 family)